MKSGDTVSGMLSVLAAKQRSDSSCKISSVCTDSVAAHIVFGTYGEAVKVVQQINGNTAFKKPLTAFLLAYLHVCTRDICHSFDMNKHCRI